MEPLLNWTSMAFGILLCRSRLLGALGPLDLLRRERSVFIAGFPLVCDVELVCLGASRANKASCKRQDNQQRFHRCFHNVFQGESGLGHWNIKRCFHSKHWSKILSREPRCRWNRRGQSRRRSTLHYHSLPHGRPSSNLFPEWAQERPLGLL